MVNPWAPEEHTVNKSLCMIFNPYPSPRSDSSSFDNLIPRSPTAIVQELLILLTQDKSDQLKVNFNISFFTRDNIELFSMCSARDS